MTYEDQWNRNRVNWLYELARCEEVGASAVRVGLLFATFLQAERREEVRPKYKWIAKHACISEATLVTAIRELEEAGFLIVRRYHAALNYYALPFDGYGSWVRERTVPYVPKVRKRREAKRD